MLILFGRKGVIGSVLDQVFGIVLSFRWTGAALAAAVMAFRSWCGRSGFPSKASTGTGIRRLHLGCQPFRCVPHRHPAAHHARHHHGTILAFAKAMGEFGATITFVSAIPGETKTLAAAIYG